MLFAGTCVCAWYAGYLLAELIPDVSLTGVGYRIQSISQRPILKGQCCGSRQKDISAVQRGGGQWLLATSR